MAAHLAYPHINLDTVAHSLRLTGPLDTTLLLRALYLTINEIDLFRARFSAQGELYWHPFSPPIDYQDLSIHLEAEPLAWRQIEQDLQRPTTLIDAPITSHQVYRLSHSEHLIYTRAHHIVLDGYGMVLFEQRLSQHYQSLLSGRRQLPRLNLINPIWKKRRLILPAIATGKISSFGKAIYAKLPT